MQTQTEMTKVSQSIPILYKHLLTPGSDRAWLIGCTCPVELNEYGQGVYIDHEGLPHFFRSSDCPLHGIKAKP